MLMTEFVGFFYSVAFQWLHQRRSWLKECCLAYAHIPPLLLLDCIGMLAGRMKYLRGFRVSRAREHNFKLVYFSSLNYTSNGWRVHIFESVRMQS